MKVRFFAYIRDITKCAETDVSYEEISAKPQSGGGSENGGSPPVTVGALARFLCNLYGEKLKQKFFPVENKGGNSNEAVKEEKIGNEIIILINGRHINHLGGLAAPLGPDDRVDIFPVVAGG